MTGASVGKPDLSRIVGHFRTACEALEPDMPEKLPSSLLDDLWARHRGAMQRVLFIDLLFEAQPRNEDRRRGGFAGFVAFRRPLDDPRETLLIGYLELLEKLLRQTNSVGSHKIFQLSLPAYNLVSEGPIGLWYPQTSKEWEDLRQKTLPAPQPVSEYFFEDTISQVLPKSLFETGGSSWTDYFDAKQIASNIPLPSASDHDTLFYQDAAKDYADWQKRCSNKPIDNNWTTFLDTLKSWLLEKFPATEPSKEVVDLRVWGIPIAMASNDANAAVGGLFVGFDNEVNGEEMEALCRSIATSSFRVNMHRRALEAVEKADHSTQTAYLPLAQWVSLRSQLASVCQQVRFEKHGQGGGTSGGDVSKVNPDIAHHFEGGGSEDKWTQDNLGSRFREAAGKCLRSLSVDKSLSFRPQLLGDWRWSASRDGGWGYPPLRALAQFDSGGHDLTIFFNLLRRYLETEGQRFAIDVLICFPAYRFKNDYLWFNAPALGEGIRNLFAGLCEDREKISKKLAQKKEAIGATIFSIVIEEFSTETKSASPSGGLRVHITQILNSEAPDDQILESGPGSPVSVGYKYLKIPAPGVFQDQGKIAHFWKFAKDAGVSKHHRSNKDAVMVLTLRATEIKMADMPFWRVQDQKVC